MNRKTAPATPAEPDATPLPGEAATAPMRPLQDAHRASFVVPPSPDVTPRAPAVPSATAVFNQALALCNEIEAAVTGQSRSPSAPPLPDIDAIHARVGDEIAAQVHEKGEDSQDLTLAEFSVGIHQLRHAWLLDDDKTEERWLPLVKLFRDTIARLGNDARTGQFIETQPLPPSAPVRYDDAMQPGDSANVPEEHVTKRVKRAKAQTTHRPPSHQPGYDRKDRQGKVGLLVQLTTEERKQLHAAAEASGCKSTQEFVTLVLAEVAKQYLDENQQKPTIPEAVERQRDAVRQAALRLAAALR